MIRAFVVLLCAFTFCADAAARGSSHAYSPRHSGRVKCHQCEHRSSHARTEFKHSHPCPSTGRSSGACAGYVIDHVTPLKRGGADAPYNMQWQTTGAAKAKDRVE